MSQLPTPMAESLTGGDVESESLTHIGLHDVEAILSALPANQRDVLTLRVIGDLTIDEVAGVIGKRRGAVKALQRRALANVRELMAARAIIEENEA